MKVSMSRILIKKSKDGLLIPDSVLIKFGYIDYDEFIIKISKDIHDFIIQPVDEVIDGVEG